MTSVESHTLNALKYATGALGDEKDEAKAQAEMEVLERPFGVLEQHLSSQAYLLGESFSVADLNVASVLLWAAHGTNRYIALCRDQRLVRSMQQSRGGCGCSHALGEQPRYQPLVCLVDLRRADRAYGSNIGIV